MKDYRLTTAEILYWMPDHRHILQTYVWQEIDLYPSFPHLKNFLHFWESELDGPIHRVNVACIGLTTPVSFNPIDTDFLI